MRIRNCPAAVCEKTKRHNDALVTLPNLENAGKQCQLGSAPDGHNLTAIRNSIRSSALHRAPAECSRVRIPAYRRGARRARVSTTDEDQE